MRFKRMRHAFAGGAFHRLVIQRRQKQRNKRHVVAQRQLSASAEAFFQALAKPAIIGLIYVKFPKFQFLLIYDNISKHNLLNSSLQIWYCI